MLSLVILGKITCTPTRNRSYEFRRRIDGADNIQSGNLLKIGNVTSSRNEYKLISLFARAHYSFKERYMITATVRRDGSSKFGANP